MSRAPVFLIAIALFRFIGFFTDPKPPEAELHRIVGEPSREPDGGADPKATVKVLTWNIERGRNPEAIARVLREHDPDVILLQEVDRFCRRTGYRDVARELGTALDLNWVNAGEFQEIGEARGDVPATIGQAVLSKTPITDAAVLKFRNQASLRWRLDLIQPRRGARIALRVRTAGLLLYDVHLESTGGDRRRSLQLSDAIGDMQQQSAGPVVIAGDFNNDPLPRSTLFAPLRSAGFVSSRPLDDPAPTTDNRRHPIDWIFVKGLTATGGGVHRIDGLSDHFPVVATLAR